MKTYRLANKAMYPFIHKTNIKSCIRCLSGATPQIREDIPPPQPTKKVRPLKMFKEPFPKSLFMGKCDPEILEYPEILSLEEMRTVMEKLNDLKIQLKESINPIEIDKTGVIPQEVINKLKDLNLFGVTVSRAFGGLEACATEAQMYGEIASIDASIWKILHEHQNSVVPLFEKFGTSVQKSNFLPKLARGEILMALANLEKTPPSEIGDKVETSAVRIEEKKAYELSGRKDWVLNPTLADYFIVFCSTVVMKDDGSREPAYTVFIVDKNTPGVTIEKTSKMSGLRGIDVATINFNNVYVPESNIIGEPNNGFVVLQKSVEQGKISCASYAIGVMKELIATTTKYLINQDNTAKPVIELDYVKHSIGKMATVLYSLESSAYLMAGILDQYQNPDVFIDSCILKVLASKNLQIVINETLQLLGPMGYSDPKFSDLSRIMRDAHFHATCDDTNLRLKITASLLGIQYSATQIHEDVKRIRNPFMYPSFVFKKMLQNRKQTNDEPQIDLGLPGYLHPSLTESAQFVEYCIARLQYATETLLFRYGTNILKEQLELKRLADIIISIYSTIAVLGRASRSYCIGLRHSDTEVMSAIVITRECVKDVKRFVGEIEGGPHYSDIKKMLTISDNILSNKGYSLEHPVARNF